MHLHRPNPQLARNGREGICINTSRVNPQQLQMNPMVIRGTLQSFLEDFFGLRVAAEIEEQIGFPDRVNIVRLWSCLLVSPVSVKSPVSGDEGATGAAMRPVVAGDRLSKRQLQKVRLCLHNKFFRAAST